MNPGTYVKELPDDLKPTAELAISTLSSVPDYTNRLLIAETILKECLDWTN